MARIAGVNIPVQKHTWVGLTHIYGIGRSRAFGICDAAGVKPETKIRDLTEAEVEGIRAQIARIAVEGDLRREVAMNIKRFDGPRLLPWAAASPWSAGAWSANEDQRAYP